MSSDRIRTAGPAAYVLVACMGVLWLYVLPEFFPFRMLLLKVLIFGLFATAYNLLLGYTGVLSFGHAAFFGLGAYSTGLWLLHSRMPLILALPLSCLVATLFAGVVGYLTQRRRGVYCAMITLALAQIVYFVAFQWRDVKGGDDSLRGIPLGRLNLLGLDVSSWSSTYFVSLTIVAASLFILYRVIHSPFGAVLKAIGENEERARACGYATPRVKIVAFMISGWFAGLAGGLYALSYRSVPIDVVHWNTSGQVLMMAVLGGSKSFIGPFVGAIAYLLAEDVMSIYTTYWQVIVGVLFVVVILYAPHGLWGAVVSLLKGRRSKQRESQTPLSLKTVARFRRES